MFMYKTCKIYLSSLRNKLNVKYSCNRVRLVQKKKKRYHFANFHNRENRTTCRCRKIFDRDLGIFLIAGRMKL